MPMEDINKNANDKEEENATMGKMKFIDRLARGN
jgi:hypothetical protein